MRIANSLIAAATIMAAAMPLAAQGSMGSSMDKDRMDHGAMGSMGMKESASMAMHDGKMMVMISHAFSAKGTADAVVYLTKDGKGKAIDALLA